MIPNTVLTNILRARGIVPFRVQEVKRSEVMKWGDKHERIIIEDVSDTLALDKQNVTSKVIVPCHYNHDGKKLFSLSLE